MTGVVGQFLAAKVFTVAERQDYTALLISPIPGTAVAGGEIALLGDTNAAPATGKSRLRVLNASSGTSDLDLYVTVPGVDLASIAPAVSGLSPAGPTRYLEVDPGTYEVRFTTGGTKTVVITGGNVTLAAGQVRTFVVAANQERRVRHHVHDPPRPRP